MVVYFLKKSNSNSFNVVVGTGAGPFARLIKEFFRFYSEWNWSHAVSLVDLTFVSTRARHYLQKTSMTILQSVYPYQNTSKNVSDEYKHIICNEIKRAFTILNTSSSDFYKIYESACKEIEFTEVKQNPHLAFKIACNQSENLTHITTLIKAKSQRLITNLQRQRAEANFRVYPDLFADENNSNVKFFIVTFHGNEIGVNTTENERILTLSNEFIRDIGSLSHVCDYSITFELKI